MADAIETDVAIVGGGPAGLSAAIALRMRGVARVMVFERESEAGGVPRHCGHPPFGLREFGRLLTGPAYARRLRALAHDRGVDILTGHSVVALGQAGRLTVATPDGISLVQARRVILATGARETPRSARLVSGDRPIGVINTGALQASIYLKGLKPFWRPVVIGTELVGLSALWTCLRHGIRPVAVIEEQAQATARWPLNLFPHLLGVPVHYGARLADIVGRSRVDHVDIATRDGQTTSLACDGVLFTGRFVPEASLLRMGTFEVDGGSGGPSIDQYGRCSDPAYFATGNLLRPIEPAGWCYREGQRTGTIVADDLSGRLAAAQREVRIVCTNGIKLAVPQRLALPLEKGSAGSVQIRVSKSMSGDLVVKSGDGTDWRRPLRARVEGRILIPLAEVSIPSDCEMLEISLEPDRQP